MTATSPLELPSEPVWTGRWVSQRLGISLSDTIGADGLGAPDLLGMALRRNPKRAHLLVSRVLGKHVPTDPRVVRAAGLRLGARVAEVLGVPDRGGAPASTWRAALAGGARAADSVLAASRRGRRSLDALVIGYAETATGLGHSVADALDCSCLHSTRRAVPPPALGAGRYAGFEEEHSHATGHQLLPLEPSVRRALAREETALVLVDDELSTGRTVENTIRALHQHTARRRYVVAALVDVRTVADSARLQELARELHTRIDVVALLHAAVRLPAGVLAQAAALLATAGPNVVPAPGPVAPDVERVPVDWPPELPVTGRHGLSAAGGGQLQHAVRPLVEALVATVGADPGPAGGDVLVLGTEELIHTPLLLAVGLSQRITGVRFSTTTRSPVLAVDDPGYAVRSSVAFRSHDPAVDGPGVRYAHNVVRQQPWAVCVLVVDAASDPASLGAPEGILAALRPLTKRLLLVQLPD